MSSSHHSKILQLGCGPLIKRLKESGYSISDIQLEISRRYSAQVSYNTIKEFVEQYKEVDLGNVSDDIIELDVKEMNFNVGYIYNQLMQKVCVECKDKMKLARDEYFDKIDECDNNE